MANSRPSELAIITDLAMAMHEEICDNLIIVYCCTSCHLGYNHKIGPERGRWGGWAGLIIANEVLTHLLAPPSSGETTMHWKERNFKQIQQVQQDIKKLLDNKVNFSTVLYQNHGNQTSHDSEISFPIGESVQQKMNLILREKTSSQLGMWFLIQVQNNGSTFIKETILFKEKKVDQLPWGNPLGGQRIPPVAGSADRASSGGPPLPWDQYRALGIITSYNYIYNMC